MDVAEIQRSYCVCAEAKGAVVGVSVHQVGSPLLPAPKPPSSECLGSEPASGAHRNRAVSAAGDLPYGQCTGTCGQCVRAGMCLLASATQQRWPGWLWVLQKDVQCWGRKPSALRDWLRAKCLFIHICAASLDLPLSSPHSCWLAPQLTTS